MTQAVKILMTIVVIQFVCSSAVFANKEGKIKKLKDMQNLCGKLDHLINKAEPKFSDLRKSVEKIEDKAAELRRVRKSSNLDDDKIQKKIDSLVKGLQAALKKTWTQKPESAGLKEHIKQALITINKYSKVSWN